MSRRVCEGERGRDGDRHGRGEPESRRGVLGGNQQAERAGEDDACGCDRDRARLAPD